MMQKHILCLTNIDELIAGEKKSRKMCDPSITFNTGYILMVVLNYTDYLQCSNTKKKR